MVPASTAARAAGAVALLGVALLVTQHSGLAEGEGGQRRVLAADTAAGSNPIPFWGKIDCQRASRHQRLSSGGDPHATAGGSGQGNDAFRRLTVFDGDNVWGERCELGWNDRRGPTSFYREGRRRITYFSLRLPESFKLKTNRWQGVMQMKQSAPADSQSGAPMISLGAYQGRWLLFNSRPGYSNGDRVVWSRRARRGRWTRFALDIRYSRKRSRGRIKVYVDLNGDGDFADRGERSRRIRTNTLKVETAGTSSDGKRTGQSLPSHLRLGIYHDTPIRCSSGCSVDVDNVQVVKP